MDTDLFLSEIYPAETPVVVKLINLETGEAHMKKITDFKEDANFLVRMNKQDRDSIHYLLALELGEFNKT